MIYTYCLKVRYPECDPMGVVYHGSYLPWLEIARTDFIKKFGLTYAEMEKRGIFVIVKDLYIDYKIPATYDDNIVILTKVKDMQTLRFSFEYEVYKIDFDIVQGGQQLTLEEIQNVKKSQLVLTATTQHIFLNAAKRPVRINREAPDIYDLLKANIPGSFSKNSKE
ncbi:MAG: acyl-CoA thioesterase [Clostridia bacterium]|nr:acyl-CoA thioesterase [Clostridia bacterium]